MGGSLLLALTAGTLGAVNPCGFALLPAYLSVLVASDRSAGPRGTLTALGRALRCTAALTLGYVLVFGAFGVALAPVAGWLQPKLTWVTVGLGLGLVAVGGWLLVGRSLPSLPSPVKAPRLTGTVPSMVLFGMGYAIASLGCAIGPFLAIVVSGLRAGSPADAVGLFLAYAAGMGLVVGVTALAVALVRASVVTRLRRASGIVPRLGGVVLLLSGGYVAYYGWYEHRLAIDPRAALGDPVVGVAMSGQRWTAGMLDAVGVAPLVVVLGLLVVIGWAAARRSAAPVAAPAVTALSMASRPAGPPPIVPPRLGSSPVGSSPVGPPPIVPSGVVAPGGESATQRMEVRHR